MSHVKPACSSGARRAAAAQGYRTGAQRYYTPRKHRHNKPKMLRQAALALVATHAAALDNVRHRSATR